MAHPAPLRKSFLKNWFAIEVCSPCCYVIIGGVLTGASWYVYRLATGPTIIWTKSNPTPWNTIKPDEGTKMLSVNQKFDKRCVAFPPSLRVISTGDRHSWTRDRL
ncbi:hypothetical protein CPB84DRAFT_1669617 [Gymnopilus junonius]|uniref:Uncharacterized protein n=1 Tax=Gymnopilus junonius TaxID=109634 RepID=A0A9P5P2C8_GYMJU|nr:hypothetical protein CPB84DRAFT_1669617 [Gymnopilus junonius]